MERRPKYEKPKNPEEKEELERLKNALSGDESTKDFNGSLMTMSDVLQLPFKKGDFLEAKAFLIAATITIFKNDIKTDIILNALGLIKWPVQENNLYKKGKSPITNRRYLFIKKSSYIEDVYRNNTAASRKYTTYKEVEQDGITDIVINALANKDRRLRKDLANVLWSKKGDFDEIITKSKEYLKLNEKKRVVDIKLPNFSYECRDLIIKRLLQYLYSLENEKPFEEEPPQTWRQLGLDGNPGTKVFMAFLVDMIETKYNIKNSSEAKRYDILFLTFNLLEGYVQRNEADLGGLLNRRYKDYLDNSDFVELSKKDHLEIDIEQLSNFENLAQSCINEISDEILLSIRHGKLNERIKYYAQQNDIESFLLPREPRYTTKNFSTERKVGRIIKIEGFLNVLPITFLLIGFSSLIAGLILYCNSKKEIPLDEIRLGSYHQLMAPGETYIIPIEFDPENATNTSVSIETTNDAMLDIIENPGRITVNTDYISTSSSEEAIVTIVSKSNPSINTTKELVITVDYNNSKENRTGTKANGKNISSDLANRDRVVTTP